MAGHGVRCACIACRAARASQDKPKHRAGKPKWYEVPPDLEPPPDPQRYRWSHPDGLRRWARAIWESALRGPARSRGAPEQLATRQPDIHFAWDFARVNPALLGAMPPRIAVEAPHAVATHEHAISRSREILAPSDTGVRGAKPLGTELGDGDVLTDAQWQVQQAKIQRALGEGGK